MSSLINIFGQYDPVKIECADDEPCIWIRSARDAVSFTLTRAQRAELRKAIDAADELDAPLPAVAQMSAQMSAQDVISVMTAGPGPVQGVMVPVISGELRLSKRGREAIIAAGGDPDNLQIIADDMGGRP